ncbi:MAG: P1 family peptidase [Deltaproteobacteria bacterium]|jgi:L-aminopeptidase/D-esterase-like protein|nr:P1 family peptidase [Deltaproteobacteria bacterium]
MDKISLTDIKGLSVGHWEDPINLTGCTVILAPEGVTASVHCPGFAPASHESDLLNPEKTVELIHGLVLAGGSSFGLSAAAGVVRYLREQGIGLDTGAVKVPLVPGAAIYDYPFNLSGGTLPNDSSGYEAAKNASTRPVTSGRYGAGKSAASGKLGGLNASSPSGLGSYGVAEDEIMVAALAVVNPLGSILDPLTSQIISGLKRPDGGLANKEEILSSLRHLSATNDEGFPSNTVLVVVATNARLSKLGCRRLAMMASAGLARSIYPAHLLFDGDTVFALSNNQGPETDPSWLGARAADAVALAIADSAYALTQTRT